MNKIINLEKIKKKKFFFVFLIRFTLSSLLTLYLNINFNILDKNYESLDYIRPALTLNNEASFIEFFNSLSARLPTYPLLISFLFKIFGENNYLSILLFQCFIHGITTVVLLKTVELFTKKFFLISFFLIALNPNIFWQTGIILPETLMVFFIALGIYFMLVFLIKKNLIKYLIFSSFFFGLSYITKPSAIFLPTSISLFVFLIFFFRNKSNFLRSLIFSTIPLIIIYLLASPIYYYNYLNTNKLNLTYQKGGHLLQYVYPCLSNKWGCGERNKIALKKALNLQEEAFEKNKDLIEIESSGNKHKKSIIESDIQTELFIKLLNEDIEKEQIITSVTGSYIKTLFHTSVISILQKHGVKYSEFSYKSYSKTDFKIKAYHVIWFIFQISLFFLRFFQLYSIFHISFYNKKNIWVIIFLTLVSLSFLVTTIGIGNFRYRIPMEPFLFIITILGLKNFKKKIKNYKFKIV